MTFPGLEMAILKFHESSRFSTTVRTPSLVPQPPIRGARGIFSGFTRARRSDSTLLFALHYSYAAFRFFSLSPWRIASNRHVWILKLQTTAVNTVGIFIGYYLAGCPQSERRVLSLLITNKMVIIVKRERIRASTHSLRCWVERRWMWSGRNWWAV